MLRRIEYVIAGVISLAAACSASDGMVLDTQPAAPASSRGPDTASPEQPASLPPGDPVAALAALSGVCSSDGWCWRDPSPLGEQITEAFATGPDNLWLAGDEGRVLAWDGYAWSLRALPAPPPGSANGVNAMFGRSSTDMWAVAGGALLYHWDGQAWTLRHSIPAGVDQYLFDVWVAPEGDVWVLADYGIVYRSVSGGPFVPVQTPTRGGLYAIWGTAGNDVWVSGRLGALLHYDGNRFETIETNTVKTLGSLWGASSDDIWAVGQDGVALHWNGTTWTQVDSGTTSHYLSVHGTSANNVWLIGNNGRGHMRYWNGSELTAQENPFGLPIYGIAATGERLWATGAGGSVYVHQAETGWAPVISPARCFHTGLWGRSSSDLWAAGPGCLRHWDGKEWTEIPVEGKSSGIYDLSGVSDGSRVDVWAIGQFGWVHHFDGEAWTKTMLGSTQSFDLQGIWAPAIGEALAVGTGGTVYRYASGSWAQISSGVSEDLFAVWGPTPDLAWIVGAKGTILTWKRQAPDTLTRVASPTTEDLYAVHGTGETTWIATRRMLLKSTPGGFVALSPPDALDLTSVFARSASEVFAGGSIGQIYRYDGQSLVRETSGSAYGISDLWVAPDGGLWAVTSEGGVLERR